MIALGLLLALVVYYYLAKFAVNAIEKYSGSKIAKHLTIAVFVLIPTWDIIPGHLYFRYLCEKEAGVKVFKTVEVDKLYFTADGLPDRPTLTERFIQPNTFDRNFSKVFHVAKTHSSIQDRSTQDVLGTATEFSYYGGWIGAFIFPQASPITCPTNVDVSVHALIWQQVVKPKGSHR